MKNLLLAAMVLLMIQSVSANAENSDDDTLPAPRCFPDTSSGIHMFGHLYCFSEKAGLWASTHYDVINRYTISVDGMRKKFKGYNPNIILLGYIDSFHAPYKPNTFLDESEFLINPEVVAAHPEWGLKKQDETPLFIKDYNRPVMDPGHPAWREYIAKQAIYATDGQPNGYPQIQVINTPFDGILLDDPFPSFHSYHLSMIERPVNPRTGKLYTEDEWHNDMKGLVKYVNDALKRRWPKNERKGYLIINGIDPFGDDEFLQKQWRDLLQFADGTALEGFIHAPWQKPDQWYTWERCIGDLEYAESQGKVVVALSNSDGGDPAFHSRLHMYALASYLVAKGKHSYFAFPPLCL